MPAPGFVIETRSLPQIADKIYRRARAGCGSARHDGIAEDANFLAGANGGGLVGTYRTVGSIVHAHDDLVFLVGTQASLDLAAGERTADHANDGGRRLARAGADLATHEATGDPAADRAEHAR